MLGLRRHGRRAGRLIPDPPTAPADWPGPREGETHVTTATVTLLDFWNSRTIDSVVIDSMFVVGTACPSGREYRHDTDSDGDDYCDLNELLANLSPHVDLLSLSGVVDGAAWTWDGGGNPRDVRGNSYTRIVVRASE